MLFSLSPVSWDCVCPVQVEQVVQIPVVMAVNENREVCRTNWLGQT